MKEKHVAVILAAGQGKRMKSAIQKQYLLLEGKPVLYYAMKAFQECNLIDEMVLVAGKEDLAFCRQEIVEKYGFTKVKTVTAGGAERYLSVYEGLKAAEPCDYVYIHDGARPFADQEILENVYHAVKKYHACVAAVPAKDTVKISGAEAFAEETPDRNRVWMVQTPQAFAYDLIMGAYEKLIDRGVAAVTDDAMVLEKMGGPKVRLTAGSYQNIKITTPEDLQIAEVFLKNKKKP